MSKKSDSTVDLAAMLAKQAKQAAAYRAANPASGGGGSRAQGNTVHAVPANASLPVESTPDFKCQGVSADGIFVYVQTYATGRKWEKKVTADAKRFDSWRAARAHWAKVQATA